MSTPRDTVNQFLILTVSFIAQLYAGTMYWFPAIIPGIAQALNFSEWQSTVIIAVATSGSVLGIIGGMFNQRYGSRLTAGFSALGVSLSYLLLGLITMNFAGSESSTNVFFVITFLSLCVNTSAYPLYSCSVAASANVFPSRYRGRVVGLNALTFGGAAGIHASVQAILFPNTFQTSANLVFVAVCALIMSVVIFFVFPQAEKYDVDSLAAQVVSIDEQRPLQHPSVSIYSEITSASVPSYDRYISPRFATAYRIALCLVFALQFNALCSVFDPPAYVKLIATTCAVTAVFSMFYLPATSSLRIYAVSDSCTPPVPEKLTLLDSPSASSLALGNFEEISVASELSLWNCVTDCRAVYLEGGFVMLVGGGGMLLLVQSLYLIDALRYGSFRIWADVDPSVIARTIVAFFTASSVTGRIILGAIIDHGDTPEQRIMQAFKMLRYNFLLMAFSVLTLAIPSKVTIILAVIGIGCSYGAFFCVAPTLTTLWFGVSTFPRNFAVYGAFAGISSLSLNSYIPAWIRSHTGHWIDVPLAGEGTISVCAGVMCILPTVLPSFTLLIAMFLFGGVLQPVVKHRAKQRP